MGESGMQYCIEIEKATEKTEERHKDRLKGVCANESLTLALNSLLDGMIGKGFFREAYWTFCTRRQRVTALRFQLLQLDYCSW